MHTTEPTANYQPFQPSNADLQVKLDQILQAQIEQTELLDDIFERLQELDLADPLSEEI